MADSIKFNMTLSINKTIFYSKTMYIASRLNKFIIFNVTFLVFSSKSLFAAVIPVDNLPVIAFPSKWQTFLPDPHSPLGQSIQAFYEGPLYIVAAIIFVLVSGLMIYIVFKYSTKRNSKPSKITHNTILEIIWTTAPALVLLIIFIPSLKLIKLTDQIEGAEMTIKIIGNQWYWVYEYPDEGNLSLTSIMIPEEEAIATGKKRLLDTDNPLVLPINTHIRLLFTSNDVIHSWSVPALSVKMDAIPGRLNEFWTQIDTPGVYYGFCTELCGANHSYMPVHLVALEKEDYKAWLKQEKKNQDIAELSDTKRKKPDNKLTSISSK